MPWKTTGQILGLIMFLQKMRLLLGLKLGR